MSNTTLYPNSKTVKRAWHLVDAHDQVLGRLATKVSRTLIGKSKRDYAPNVDCGDVVVVINAEGIKIKGNNKATQKIDFRHSGYPGGDTMTPYSEMMRSKPDKAIYLAVKGMLPKNRLRSRQLQRLKIFKGASHPHSAQFAATSKASSN